MKLQTISSFYSSSSTFLFLLLLFLLLQISKSRGDEYSITVPSESLSHSIVKRNVPVSVSNLTSAFRLNDGHLHLTIHWVGSKSPQIFCLARDRVIMEDSTSSVFLSSDYGTTFDDISHKFKIPSSSLPIITKHYPHKGNKCFHVFTDVIHKYLFVSNDCGSTFDSISLPFTPSHLEFDPVLESVFLIHDLDDSARRLYVLSKYGKEIHSVHYDYIFSFHLHQGNDSSTSSASSMTTTTLYLQRQMPDSSKTNVIAIENYSNTKLPIIYVIYNNVEEFYILGKYLFVTIVDLEHGDPYKKLLLAPIRTKKFLVGDFGQSPILDYHIVDVSEDGLILIAANLKYHLTNLYVSAYLSESTAKFVLSFDRLMFYNPKIHWRNSWLSKSSPNDSFVDIYKVEGLRGIYIASQIKSSFNISSNTYITPNDLISYITFDYGALWSVIQGPLTDDEGFRFPECEVKHSKCSLHISQQLSQKFPTARTRPILSSETAIGIILASGNVGKHLQSKSNVYLSADGGLSWHQILKGSYYYNLADHGGIIVALKYYKMEEMTNELLYSTNEGLEWKSLFFYSEPIKIFGLLTEPGAKTTIFTIFGSLSSLKAPVDWIIIKVDLKSIFSHNCTDDDYKKWSPADNLSNKHSSCIMGRKEVFERRIINSGCYNGREREKIVSVENCGCDRSDFQCDFGFVREERNLCVWEPSDVYDPHEIPVYCKPGLKYNRTSGYKKILGNTCSGGYESRYLPTELYCPLKAEKDFLIIAQRKKLLRLNLRNLTDVEVLPLDNVQNVITLEYDTEEDCVMWGDLKLDQIRIQCLNESVSRILLEKSLRSVEGMAYDWISKALYFVDGERKVIELIKTNNGKFRKTILDGKRLKKPRGLAVHPLHGYLFFSDWNTEAPFIGRANMDGSEVMDLFTKPLVKWPNGLSLDYMTNRLYWVDANQDFIASCDMDGKTFKKILQKSPFVVHPFAVGTHKELMFWDDWTSLSLYAANKNTGEGIQTILENMPGGMDLKIYSRSSQSGTNSCSQHSCSHHCVPLPNSSKIPRAKEGYRCLCPDGMKEKLSSDGMTSTCLCPDSSVPEFNGTCHQLANGTCLPFQFNCRNSLCILDSWKCDGFDDCGDRSDETDCIIDVCYPYQFTCSNKKCILSQYVCDGDDDCEDNSDESNCKKSECLPHSEFQCNDGKCINRKWRCDREHDCSDGSDEENCIFSTNSSISSDLPLICKNNEFKCEDSGQCIPFNWKCDSEKDCPNGQDEENCSSNQTCTPWQFQCNTGQCIFEAWKCDGDPDCVDSSDELNCTSLLPKRNSSIPIPIFPHSEECTDWMFKCENQQCIPYWWKCDGTNDCSDGTDELQCSSSNPHFHNDTILPPSNVSFTCPHNKFQCLDSTCIWQAWVCDSEADCKNGEDEDSFLCQHKESCGAKDFICNFSGECISHEFLCDGKEDCGDRSDERNCESSSRDPFLSNSSNCESGFFHCDEHCIPDFKYCDGKMDCYDGTDEDFCSEFKGHGSELSLISDDELRRNDSLTVHWRIDSYSPSLLYVQPAIAVAGTNNWTEFPWQKIQNASYTFSSLRPHLLYNISIKVSKLSHGTPLSSNYISVITRSSLSSPPQHLKALSNNGNIILSWNGPKDLNGVFKKYLVRLYVDDNILIRETENEFMVYDSSFLSSQKSYRFSVIAVNDLGVGAMSEFIEFFYDISDLEIHLTSILPSFDSVFLSWKSLPNIEQILITYDADENSFFTSQKLVVAPTSKEGLSSINITGLTPSEKYRLQISSLLSQTRGPLSEISFTTTGQPLPSLTLTEAKLSPISGTIIHLKWKLEENGESLSYYRNSKWIYGVYYGVSEEELLRSGKRFVTQNNSIVLSHLNACESYIFRVGLIGPHGLGRPSNPFVSNTKYSPGAPPKNLKATPSSTSVITLEWESSCPYIEDLLGYYISVTDTVIHKNNLILLANSKERFFKYEIINLKNGGQYEAFVKTNTANSIPSETLRFNGPEIAKAYGLTHRRESESYDQFVYWSVPDNISSDFTYELHLSKDIHFNDSQKFIVAQPPFIISESILTPGKLYYLYVKIVDPLGYSSPPSAIVTLENPIKEPQILVTENKSADILIPLLIILLLLSSALGFYIYRHKKLSRSFQALASRYTPSSGAYILNPSSSSMILDDETEEEDSPIIRAFSDDEPLVVR